VERTAFELVDQSVVHRRIRCYIVSAHPQIVESRPVSLLTLVEPAVADNEGIEAHVVFPIGHDRARALAFRRAVLRDDVLVAEIDASVIRPDSWAFSERRAG
jgi:hypothetical protein